MECGIILPAEGQMKKFLKKIKKTFQKGIDKPKMLWYTFRVAERRLWEHSSAGRASALQAEGHRFEPYCSHHKRPGSSVG